MVTAAGYQPGISSAASRVDLQVVENPNTVSTLTSDYLADRQPQDLRDALRLVPGITLGDCCDRGVNITLRGVQSAGPSGGLSNSISRQDGLAAAFPSFGDFIAVERVEVLKGPASVLGGSNSGGGTINRVTKQPRLGVNGLDLSASIGSPAEYRASADADVALSDGAAARIIAGYIGDSRFERQSDSNLYSLTPTRLLKLGDATRLTLIGEYSHLAAGTCSTASRSSRTAAIRSSTGTIIAAAIPT